MKAVSNAMKENLGKKKTKVIKSFSFDVNTPYEKEVIGADETGSRSLVQLPSFVGKTVDYVRSYCSSHGISVSVKGGNGYVLSQSVPSGANVEDVSSITVTAGGNTTSTPSTSSSSSSSSKDNDDENDALNGAGIPTPPKEDGDSTSSGSSTGGSQGGSSTGGDGGTSDDTSTDAEITE